MSEHTPGPWIINSDPNYESGKPAIIWGPKGSGYGAVCNMNKIYPQEFNEADARLIAASPDLLETCKAWAKYDSESFDKSPCPDLTLKVHYRDEARKLTKIALAKADPS